MKPIHDLIEAAERHLEYSSKPEADYVREKRYWKDQLEYTLIAAKRYTEKKTKYEEGGVHE